MFTVKLRVGLLFTVKFEHKIQSRLRILFKLKPILNTNNNRNPIVETGKVIKIQDCFKKWLFSLEVDEEFWQISPNKIREIDDDLLLF